jgi:hypothetical protein
MRDSSLRDSIQTPIGLGAAPFPPNTSSIVPDIPNYSNQARELKEALRDPEFARTFNKELRTRVFLLIVAMACFLFLFFFLGFLLTR